MKILLTGGAGFIGSHIADAYLALGHKVVIMDDLSGSTGEHLPSKADFFKGDVSKSADVAEVFDKFGPFEAINHHSAQKSVPQSIKDPVQDAKQNIIASLNIFSQAKKRKVGKIIFASSGGALYGDKAPIPSSEGAPKEPASPYGIAKLATEHYLRFFSKNFPIKAQVFRYANVYGPRQDPRGEAGVVAIFCKNIIKNKPLTIFGDGLQTRDFVFVEDIVKANVLALNNSLTGIFNLGTGKETPILQIAQLLKKIAQGKGFDTGEIEHLPARIEQRRSALDFSNARLKLHWKPQTSFKRGLGKTLDYFLLKKR